MKTRFPLIVIALTLAVLACSLAGSDQPESDVAPVITQIVITQINGSPVKTTPQATYTFYPTYTPYPTYTQPAALPALPPAPADTPVPPPAPTSAFGSFNDPVAIGSDYSFPGFGRLTVLESQWQPQQTGLAIIKLRFVCERPAEQQCEMLTLMLGVVGGTGNGYEKSYESGIPDPGFFSLTDLYGGGVREGYMGFLITGAEDSLKLTAQLLLQDMTAYFKLSP